MSLAISWKAHGKALYLPARLRLMVELFFIIYYIPKTMTRLARERNRSAIVWSLTGIGAWVAAELVVWLVFWGIYGAGVALRGWPGQLSSGLRFFVYVVALAAAGGSLLLVERNLDSRSRARTYTEPPPPPRF